MLNMMYRLILYDIDDFLLSNEWELTWIINLYYYITGVFFLVVILNLFLAILFDTYDKVIKNKYKFIKI